MKRIFQSFIGILGGVAGFYFLIESLKSVGSYGILMPIFIFIFATMGSVGAILVQTKPYVGAVLMFVSGIIGVLLLGLYWILPAIFLILSGIITVILELILG